MRDSQTLLRITAAVLTLGMSACESARTAPVPPTPVRTALVESLTNSNTVKYSATIEPYAQVDLAFKSGGYVDHILQVKDASGRTRNVDQGDWVKQGTVLALVHQQDYQDKLQQAKAQLQRAQAEFDKSKLSFDRTSVLYSAQSATKPDYDSAKASLDSNAAAVDSAKAQISEAQVALDYCSLRTPFDGWIVKRNVDVGSLVNPATTGFTLADTRSVRAVFGVPDVAMGQVKLGQRLATTTDAVPGVFNGRVTTISPAADPKSRVYSVEVAIDNARGELKSGMIASLNLGGSPVTANLKVVPLEAVVRDPRQTEAFAVMIADGNGDAAHARLRSVELGDAYGNKIAILKGLDINERVITSGVNMLKDGDAVRLLP